MKIAVSKLFRSSAMPRLPVLATHCWSQWQRLKLKRAVGQLARRDYSICILQSCDESYLPLLSQTAPVNQAYARRHAYAYLSFVGNSSPIPHTANFNRYYLMRELQRRTSISWCFWMDADSLVIDSDIALEPIIQADSQKMLIACSGEEAGYWDINNGVFFLNLRHPRTSALLEHVITKCEFLQREDRSFYCDQQVMQAWLAARVRQGESINCWKRYSGDQADFFNYDGAFIRHVLREAGSLEVRVELLKKLVQECVLVQRQLE